MKIVLKEDIKKNKGLRESLKEKIFIYPTDTIYGIGCNAERKDLVEKIRQIKQRPTQPFSIIAPSISWIKQNCILNENSKIWLEKLPGPYTVILKIRNKKAIAKNVSDSEPLGVRIPSNWFSEIVSKLNVPIITTSVNIAGHPFMTSLNNLETEIKDKVDIIINEGQKNGAPSTIIDLTKAEPEIISRG